MSESQQPLTDALAVGNEAAIFRAAHREALAQLDALDREGLGTLLKHDSSAVRHGVAEALADRAGDLGPIVDLLVQALPTNTGAVLYFGMQAIKRAAAAGVDISPASELLNGLLTRDRYEIAHWAYSVSPEEQSDILDDRPDCDAAQALTHMSLESGDLDQIRGLLTDDTPAIIDGALTVLTAGQSAQSDARRELVARLLVPAYAALGFWPLIDDLVGSTDTATNRGARTGLGDALANASDAAIKTRLEALAAE